MTEGKFVLNWFEGEMAPSCLEDIVLCQNEEDREVEDGSSNDMVPRMINFSLFMLPFYDAFIVNYLYM